MAISFQQNKASKPLFTQESQRRWPLMVLIGLSVLLMCLDAYHYKTPQMIRYGVSYIVAPIQFTVDYPQRIWRFIQALMSSKRLLMQENIKLRYQQTLLEAKLQHFIVLKAENLQLKALLRHYDDKKTQAVVAQVLDLEVSQTRQIMVLDKGWQDGICVGQAVLDAKGVMGQVIDVGPMTSTVLLISDMKSAVPVRNHRTGEWGILMGTNQPSQLGLLNLPQTSQTRPGDLLVTSGLGGHYPQGYPVGIVQRLDRISGEAFLSVQIYPIAKLNQSQLVLVLLHDPNAMHLREQVKSRLYALGILR